MKALRLLSIFALGLTLVISNVKAQEFGIKFTPETDPFPFPFPFPSGAEKRNEPSAIEFVGSGLYLIADDEISRLALFDKGGGLVRIHSLPQELPRYVCQQQQRWVGNVKWEAMAKDGEEYYVIGAHREVSQRHLFRFRLNPASDPSKIDIDPESIHEFDIADSLTRQDLGLRGKPRIEGLAVRRNAGKTELIIGLREPTTLKGGLVLVHGYPAFPVRQDCEKEKLPLPPFFTFNAGKPTSSNIPFHLSSLEYVPSWHGFLVMTSTEDESVGKKDRFFGNKLWFFSDANVASSKAATSVEDLQLLTPTHYSREFENEKKAEGLTIVGECDLGPNEKLISVAIVYDNDGKPAGMMQFAYLSMSAK